MKRLAVVIGIILAACFVFNAGRHAGTPATRFTERPRIDFEPERREIHQVNVMVNTRVINRGQEDLDAHVLEQTAVLQRIQEEQQMQTMQLEEMQMDADSRANQREMQELLNKNARQLGVEPISLWP